jgi:sugar fermentation stimulation protein A
LQFNKPLIEAKLIKRYKRFLADVRLADGKPVTAHCPNSGSMKTCQEPGWKVLLSESDKPGRRYRYTWEMTHNGKCWIGVNTMIPNIIAAEAIGEGRIPELAGYPELKREVKYGQNSRIDLLLRNGSHLCYVEVKNVTLVESDGSYQFPDAVTERGQKHLRELVNEINNGHRAVMLYVIQRDDGTIFRPAEKIDADYTKALREAHRKGVEILPWIADVNPEGIRLSHKIDFDLG